MQSMVNIDNEVTITLKDLTDLIGARHNDAMRKVRKLEGEEGFGTLREFHTVYNDKGQTVKTYLLSKKQAIAVGALLNNKLLMIVINRLEELEAERSLPPQLTNAQFMANAVLMAQEELKQVPVLQEEVKIVTHKYEQAVEDKDFLAKEITKRDRVTNDMSNRGSGMLVRDWAKALTNLEEGVIIKQSDLREMLKEKKYLMYNGLPYAHHVKSGYFKIKENSYVDSRGEDVPTYTTVVTKKGMEKLHDKAIAYFTTEENYKDMPF